MYSLEHLCHFQRFSYFIKLVLCQEAPEFNLLLEHPLWSSSNSRNTDHVVNLQKNNSINSGVERISSMEANTIKQSTIYPTTNILWAIIDFGCISGIGCMLSFYMVVYINGIPMSKEFFSADDYFLLESPDLVLRDCTVIGFEEQLSILFDGQNTFFGGLIICQFCNMLLCRREKEYFFTRFFDNPKILIFSFFRIGTPILIVFIGFLDAFLLVRKPPIVPLRILIATCASLLITDTIIKYRRKQIDQKLH